MVVVYQYLSALCHTALRHKLAQSSTIHKQTTHSHKTVDLDDVSFTYTVYKSVKDQQGIESSVRHYVPKRAFHMVWIAAAVLWLWQARHRSLVYIQYKLQNTRVKPYKECTQNAHGGSSVG